MGRRSTGGLVCLALAGAGAVIAAGARLALAGGDGAASASGQGVATRLLFAAPRPSFEGKVMIRRADGSWQDRQAAAQPPAVPSLPIVTVGADSFLADGAEPALAVDTANGNNLVTVLNRGYSNSVSLLTSTDGNAHWAAATFPNGAGTFSGQPFDPWAEAGNVAGDLFTSFIRRDTASPSNHVVLARGRGGLASWSRFFEATRDVAQDRAMFDIDRTASQGGGAGSDHDGKIYLTYDGFDPLTGDYIASYLQVVSPSGAPVVEVQTSSPRGFNGYEMQPVAGTTDGQVYLMALGFSPDGATTYLIFHEVDGAGAFPPTFRSFVSFPTTGQPLGTTGRFGVNGHRINVQMQMDIDRSSGRRRGTLYVVTNLNPNPADRTLDQGDLWLWTTTDGAATWSAAPIPGVAAGKTQFFSMLDVDDDGWIHVAYYQNEAGGTDNGVLNASTANVYYTVSSDGGRTWAPPTQVNAPADSLKYFDPPPDLQARDYYLIGDYCQVRAGFAAGTRVAYVCWTQYDKNRTDFFLNDKRERVICTRMIPALDTDRDGVFDPQDNCPTLFNPGQEDANGNGIGDICESFLSRANVDDTGSSQGRIDGSDLFPLARAFGACTGSGDYDPRVDLSPEGCVDGYDLALLAGVWGESVP